MSCTKCVSCGLSIPSKVSAQLVMVMVNVVMVTVVMVNVVMVMVTV